MDTWTETTQVDPLTDLHTIDAPRLPRDPAAPLPEREDCAPSRPLDLTDAHRWVA